MYKQIKHYGAVLIVLSLALSMTACSDRDSSSMENGLDSKPQVSSQSEPSNTSNSVSEQPPAEPILDEMGLPKMTEEYQAYYDKYLRDFNNASPFLFSFSQDNFEFFNVCSVYSALISPEYDDKVKPEIVENKIAEFFPISPEKVGSMAGIHDLTPDKSAYKIFAYPESILTVGVVTDVQKTDDTLVLTCDWYETSTPEQPTYKKHSTSVTTIELRADGSYFYRLNQSTKVSAN